MVIHLALTHDWELRGDGSGDIELLQFAPLRSLLEIYKKFGARTTILPDIAQQLAFRRFEYADPDLRHFADAWDEHVRQAFRQGHDVQLHLHPHWQSARYAHKRWHLDGDWSILNYDRDTAFTMLAEAKEYLESVLHSIDSAYHCVAFRAGALAAAPSDHLLPDLAELGVKIDVSLAGGLFVNSPILRLDYRGCEESFLPFFPLMQDARKLSDKPEPIVCVPLHHFYGSRHAVARQNAKLARRELGRRLQPTTQPAEDSAPRKNLESEASRGKQLFEKLVRPLVKRKYFVSDLSRLDYSLMHEMLGSIRRRARASGLTQVPVVLTNHPKDIRDLAAIERFIGDLSEAKDIEFITLSEVWEKIQNGDFKVRNRNGVS